MKICIAFARFAGGHSGVYRGQPQDVSGKIAAEEDKHGCADILCVIDGDITTEEDEERLWMDFVREAAKKDLEVVANEKATAWTFRHELLRSSDTQSWVFFLPTGLNCIFGSAPGQIPHFPSRH